VLVPFDPQPQLSGRNVSLRPLHSNDRDALYAVASDPLIWAQHPSPDRHRRDQFDVFFDQAIASGGAMLILDGDGSVIGTSRFHGYDPGASQVEIGWTFLIRDHWGGATNREVKDLMLAHAFASVDRVIFRIGPENLRSRRAIEKLGAGQLGETIDETGQRYVVYALRRPGGRERAQADAFNAR
jgi:N-acetyltransferase